MEFEFYFVLFGDVRIGKTTFINLLVKNEFINEYEGTQSFLHICSNFVTDSFKFKVDFWEFSGNDYQNLGRLYYKEDHTIVLFYDITNSDSLLISSLISKKLILTIIMPNFLL